MAKARYLFARRMRQFPQNLTCDMQPMEAVVRFQEQRLRPRTGLNFLPMPGTQPFREYVPRLQPSPAVQRSFQKSSGKAHSLMSIYVRRSEIRTSNQRLSQRALAFVTGCVLCAWFLAYEHLRNAEAADARHSFTPIGEREQNRTHPSNQAGLKVTNALEGLPDEISVNNLEANAGSEAGEFALPVIAGPVFEHSATQGDRDPRNERHPDGHF